MISPNAFVFPFLNYKSTPNEELNIKRQLIKQINKHVRQIAEEVGKKKKITTYTAGIALPQSQNALARLYIHFRKFRINDIRTTEDYLDTFEDDVKRQYASNLTDLAKKDSR